MMRDRFVAGIKSEILQKKLLQEEDDVTLDKVFACHPPFLQDKFSVIMWPPYLLHFWNFATSPKRPTSTSSQEKCAMLLEIHLTFFIRVLCRCRKNPRTTLLELEQDTGISKTTIGRIVTEDLRLKKTPAKFIPRFLTNEQKLCRLATCEDMLEMTRTDPEWKGKIITGEETWVYGYDPETKPQSAEWRDIAPNDFFLFPKLKAVLKGRYFDTREDIIEKSLLALKSIPKEAYKNCFDNWEKRWRWIFQGLISTLQLVEKLDRYPLRNKRKFDSVEPEETSMNVKTEAGTQVSNYVVQHLPRNPSIFSGEDGEDLQKWLKGYARVAKYNHWDETLCLTKVYFYLSGTALKWFENNEESIQTWKEFTSQLENVFGKKENSKLQAEKKLKTRAQLKGESTEFYIQDVLCLCKEADLQMSEEDKISHLMKGIAEEFYQALLPRDVQSTEQFITECRRVEALRCRRVTPTRYERLPNVASLCDQDDGEDLSSLIRKIVREEIKQALDSPQEEPKIAVIKDLVREEIIKTLAPRSKPTISPPQASRPESNTRYEAQTIRPYPEPHYRKQGRRCDTNEWRTTEGSPICFYCGRPGHVVRYCRDRKRHNEERRKEYFQRKQDAMVFYNFRAESQDPNDESSRKNFTRYRSPTSYPGFHRRVKAKTSFQDDDVPIDDDTTTKPLFTPQENGRKEFFAHMLSESGSDGEAFLNQALRQFEADYPPRAWPEIFISWFIENFPKIYSSAFVYWTGWKSALHSTKQHLSNVAAVDLVLTRMDSFFGIFGG
ncbi:hypothetical protein LAZ67_20001247 [Cordylochernes scorpioides]|uniref:CCHC-type domain-containing protein n=1 Tax=Cordylochernes scorpioides TaxID=51811 RepID=A0ABY6LK28_9ARAC|nr:hypothetical protein LAZ67_20001247 [Cordylochernes scorpioides]